MKRLNIISTIFDRFIDVLAVIAGIVVILVMLAISTEVVTRYFLNRPVTGMIEAVEISILYITFLSAAWVLREEAHVSMDFLTERLKPKALAMLTFITSLLCAGMCLVLVWYGTNVVLSEFQKGYKLMGNLDIKMGYVLLIIPVGSLAFFIQFLRRAYKNWKKWQAPQTEKSMQNMKATDLDE